MLLLNTKFINFKVDIWGKLKYTYPILKQFSFVTMTIQELKEKASLIQQEIEELTEMVEPCIADEQYGEATHNTKTP